MRPTSLALLVIGLLNGAASPALAEYVVFKDGRLLKVATYRFVGDQTVVELEGGGRMSFGVDVVKYLAPDEDVEPLPPGPVHQPAHAIALSQAPDWRSQADPRFAVMIEEAGRRHGIEPAVIAAVIKVESDFRPHAISPRGAQGLMQLMPITAREHGVEDAFDAASNIDGGTAHLRELLTRYGEDLQLALAAYNAGQTAVEKAKGIPPYPETRSYVTRVLALAGL